MILVRHCNWMAATLLASPILQANCPEKFQGSPKEVYLSVCCHELTFDHLVRTTT